MVEYCCVRCCNCSTFQAQQVTKSGKFVCKICFTKQTRCKLYGVSYEASRIRELVQKLNLSAAEADQDDREEDTTIVHQTPQLRVSKVAWSQYVEESADLEERSSTELLEVTQGKRLKPDNNGTCVTNASYAAQLGYTGVAPGLICSGPDSCLPRQGLISGPRAQIGTIPEYNPRLGSQIVSRADQHDPASSYEKWGAFLEPEAKTVLDEHPDGNFVTAM